MRQPYLETSAKTHSASGVVSRFRNARVVGLLAIVTLVVMQTAFGLKAEPQGNANKNQQPSASPSQAATAADQPIPTEGISLRLNDTSKESRYRFQTDTPQPTTIAFNGDREHWRFVRFDDIPQNVKLIVKDSPGYGSSEELTPATWYPFKKLLPISLSIDPIPAAPVIVRFTFGDVKSQATLQNYKIAEVRTFLTKNSDQITASNEQRSLGFTWGNLSWPSVTANKPLAAPATETPTPQPRFFERVLNFVFDSVQSLVVSLVLFVIALCVVYFGTRWAWRWWKDHSHRRQRQPYKSNEDLEEVLSGDHKTGGWTPGTMIVGGVDIPGRTVNVPRTREVETPPPAPVSVGRADSQIIADVEALNQRLDQIEKELRGKANRSDITSELNSRIADLRRDFQSDMAGFQQNIKAASNQHTTFESTLKGFESALTSQLESIEEQKAIGATKAQLVDASRSLREWQEGIDKRLRQFEDILIEQALPESLFARILGTLLGKSIDELRNGNFEQNFCERLNKFFQEEIPRGNVLSEVRPRADGINAKLRLLHAQLQAVNVEAANEIAPYLRRAEALTLEIADFQSQLHNRRVTLQARVPVSTYPGARQSFLEELGRAMRKEIDKLADPENYFEADFERLITADIVSVVDICDKHVASQPGLNPEFESTFRELFADTGLSDILPKIGEPFRTAEHDLIATVSDAGGESLTVAKVLTRGFHYTHRANKTILRKAQVDVFS